METLDALRRRYAGRAAGLLGARRNYAVLCPFVERQGKIHLVFEVRAKSLRQGGEVCFPGGAMEPGETAEQCALRETAEELGIPPREITLFGRSSFLADQESLFLQPVLGEVTQTGFAAICPSAAEVAEVFTVPFSFFIQTPPEVYDYTLSARPSADFPYERIGISRDYFGHSRRVSVPVWEYGGHVIWGMTGRILQDLTGRYEKEEPL